MNESILEEIKNICQKNKDSETCGFILKKNKKYITTECSNVSSNSKSSFEIPDEEYIFAYKNFKIISIFHSHVIGDHSLSKEDLLISEELDIPIIVYSLKSKKFNFHNPNNNPKEQINVFFKKKLSIKCNI